MSDDPFDILNKVKNEQLSTINFKSDAKEARQTNEWDNNRQNIIKNINKCEWCGSEPEEIHIHHTWGKSFSRQWMKSSDEAFIESDEYLKSLTNNREHCPNCNKKDYYSRKTKQPEYRCNNCETEFSEVETIDGGLAIKDDSINNKPYTKYEYFKKKAEWVQDNKDTVRDYFFERYNDILDEYVSMREDQIVPICGRCHYLEEQTSKKRCENCEENWYDPRKIRDNMCWDCIIEEKGLEKCPLCEENWYNPEKNDKCKDC